MKHVFVFFTIILALFPEVYAEGDKWIDGIRIRSGNDQHNTNFKIDAENFNASVLESDVAKSQLIYADILLINKCDLVNDNRILENFGENKKKNKIEYFFIISAIILLIIELILLRIWKI